MTKTFFFKKNKGILIIFSISTAIKHIFFIISFQASCMKEHLTSWTHHPSVFFAVPTSTLSCAWKRNMFHLHCDIDMVITWPCKWRATCWYFREQKPDNAAWKFDLDWFLFTEKLKDQSGSWRRREARLVCCVLWSLVYWKHNSDLYHWYVGHTYFLFVSFMRFLFILTIFLVEGLGAKKQFWLEMSEGKGE